MKQPLVSIVVPTRNNAPFLEDCLLAIKNQTYKDIEIIIVDNNSTDNTKEIARKYTNKVFDISKIKTFHRKFSATYQRNYGVNHSRGEIIYYLDADMIMTKEVISECVQTLTNNADAIIITEDSFGSSFWAKCKQLERRCYWGDDTIEAPRCFKKCAWEALGGLDENISGGGDDWDLYQKAIKKKLIVKRINSKVLHNEGNLMLIKLIKKRFLYGKDTVKYLKKYKETALWQYFPMRKSYFKNWKLFIKNPIIGIGVIFMRAIEYAAGALGIIYNLSNKK